MLEDIYQRHADFVWRTLQRMGVTHDEVADAVQDVFLIVHQELDRFEGRSALSTWLFTICRSVAIRRRGQSRRRLEHLTNDEVDDVIDLRADVGRAVETNQDLLLLESILSALETNQRNVFILFELERMSGEEISEALSIPLGTVYSRLQLARKAFRTTLDRHQARASSKIARAGGGS
jgi:RNA polymerase sigma-70 factor (ECF subfamily)